MFLAIVEWSNILRPVYIFLFSFAVGQIVIPLTHVYFSIFRFESAITWSFIFFKIFAPLKCLQNQANVACTHEPLSLTWTSVHPWFWSLWLSNVVVRTSSLIGANSMCDTGRQSLVCLTDVRFGGGVGIRILRTLGTQHIVWRRPINTTTNSK